jgi:hypothetical protein
MTKGQSRAGSTLPLGKRILRGLSGVLGQRLNTITL